MNWLRNFMAGRYGADHLNLALLAVSLLLSLFLGFVPVPFLGLLAYVPLFWGIYRMLSRNLLKRSEENRKFLAFWNQIKGWFQRKKNRINNQKYYRFYHCPGCKQTLRLPKGRGKIRITCPKCGRMFEKKT